jgi:hypothetical protein
MHPDLQTRHEHYSMCLAIITEHQNKLQARTRDMCVPHVDRDAHRMMAKALSKAIECAEEHLAAIEEQHDVMQQVAALCGE